jgi:hypothetical protein
MNPLGVEKAVQACLCLEARDVEDGFQFDKGYIIESIAGDTYRPLEAS